jgi:hypothetical protein
MGTTKDIFDKGLSHGMGEKDEHEEMLPKRADTSNLEYSLFERTKTGEPSFNAYVESLSQEMQTYDAIDPYKKNPLKEITDKADAFLRRHANISYEDFLRQAKPEDFTGNDYGKLPAKRNLRRRLFTHRAMLYLSALEDCEKKGHDIKYILREVEQGTIPYIKKERDEPTFQEILRVLRKKN